MRIHVFYADDRTPICLFDFAVRLPRRVAAGRLRGLTSYGFGDEFTIRMNARIGVERQGRV